MQDSLKLCMWGKSPDRTKWLFDAVSCSVVSDFLQPMDLIELARLLSPWNSPDKNTGAGLPFPSPGDLPDPGLEPESPALQADSLPSESPGKPHIHTTIHNTDRKNLLYSTGYSTQYSVMTYMEKESAKSGYMYMYN